MLIREVVLLRRSFQGLPVTPRINSTLSMAFRGPVNRIPGRAFTSKAFGIQILVVALPYASGLGEVIELFGASGSCTMN